MQKRINTSIIITTLCLFIVIGFFEVTSFDLVIQEYFFEFSTGSWILNSNEPIAKFIFYDGIKKIIILFSLIVLVSLIFFRKKEIVKKYKQGLIIVLLSLIIIPLCIGSLKAVTNTPCPKNIEYFGGNYPNVQLFDAYPQDFIQESNIKCWPAGHASGGFALMSLFFLFRKRKNRIVAVVVTASIGWAMGLYKMLIGDHFLSHTIITMLIAWLIILMIVKIVHYKE